MGEMAMGSRARKDLVTSFRRLRGMTMDLKSARKSLVAHHNLLAELVSVAFYPSSKDSGEPQAPKSVFLSPSPSRRPPSRNPSPPLQQNVRIETQSSLPCSFPPSASKNPLIPSLRSLSLKASSSLSSLAPKNGEISFSQEEAGFHSSKILRSAASYDPSKRFAHQSVFWASLFLVFLCFFLYTGKEVAVVLVVNAYIIIWIACRLQSVAFPSHSRKAVGPVLCDEDDDVQEIPASNFSEISTISASQGLVSCSSESCGPLRERGKWDLAGYSQVSDATCKGSSQSSFKLSMILVLALSGLACSHFVAVCLCSFCILLLSILQGPRTTRRRRLRLN